MVTGNGDTSWRPDRVVYVASGDRRVTAGMIEELLAARETQRPARPAQRRAAARAAEREAIAARPQLAKGLVPGRGQAPATPPPAPRVGPSKTELELTAARATIEDLEDEADLLRRALAARMRVSKEAVGYRPGSAERNCAGCVMYDDRSCDLVRGLIDPDAVCDRWSRR